MSVHVHIDAPLYGVAGEQVEGELLAELLRRQSSADSPRKARAKVAHDVYAGRLEHLILHAINHQQTSATVKRDMSRFVCALRNDARDVVEQVAVAYKHGAIRHLADDGDDRDEMTTAQEQALRDIAEEMELDEVGEQVSHLAWLQGPQFVVPLVRDGAVTLDVLGPHVYDYVQDERYPHGMPVALAWPVGTSDVHHERLVHVLDSVSLRLFHLKSTGIERISTLEHHYGRLPAALLRFGRPLPGDEWCVVDRQRRLTQGTIEVGVLFARMGLVRKAQCHKLLTMVGDLETVARGQEKGSPEVTLTANTGGRAGRSVEFEALDYDTDPAKFIRHLLFVVQSMIEPYGGHVSVGAGPEIFGRIEIPPEAQAEHRKRQIRPVRRFERQLWSAVVTMLRAEQHPAALDLPPADEIAKRLRITLGELSRKIEDPVAEQAYEDWQLHRGQTSEARMLARKRGISIDEAWRLLEQHMLERARFNDFAARNNLPTSSSGVQTTPEANGAKGTPQREANRAAEAAQGETVGGGRRPANEPT